MSKWILSLAALALAACQSAPPTPPAPAAIPSPAPYHLVDLTGAYGEFFDRTAAMPAPERVTAFKQEFNTLFPGFYDVARMPWVAPERFDARIARSFERYPEQRAAIATASARFAERLAPAYATFARAFPDIAPIGDIYLVHSLGEMDGGTREIDGRVYFVFGADVMAQAHAYTDETPFFHHELFHIYHQQFFTGCQTIWCPLWSEGLAVYVAQQLNPNASDDQLLLTWPEPIRAPVDANLQEAVCAVRARLDSQSDEDAGALFSADRLNDRLPPRFGYYIGYLAAREAAKTHSLAELAHLSSAEVRPVLEAALDQLATRADGH